MRVIINVINRMRNTGERVGEVVRERLRSVGRAAPDGGMSTAEYAVGTIAAAAFAGLLFKIVTSAQVRTMLTGIIRKALELAG